MKRLLLCAFAVLLGAAGPQARAVQQVAPDRLAVTAQAKLPIFVSADWSRPLPRITRVLVIFHGLGRTAANYYTEALQTLTVASGSLDDTLVIAPQFLAEVDVSAHALASDTLAWGTGDWMEGAPAHRPAPISTYTAIDAMLARLADRGIFPALRNVVLAGHSAGGQTLQRYAVVGRGDAALTASGIAVRYVIANPSSYLYFTPERPDAQLHLVPFNAAGCAGWNNWKYGFGGGAVPYVQGEPAELERRYAQRDVTYLLGTADIDPNHPQLDKSCGGEAQGPFRLARGHGYFAAMQARNGPLLHQRLLEVQGVAHNEAKMFQSACGLAALFDVKGCPNGS